MTRQPVQLQERDSMHGNRVRSGTSCHYVVTTPNWLSRLVVTGQRCPIVAERGLHC